MKYNSKYDRWFTKGGLVYRYDSKQDKLVLCKQSNSRSGYKVCRSPKLNQFRVHRAIYETFVGEIPQGYEIDHINTVRTDNRLENLRCVTSKENNNNSITLKHKSESQKNKIKNNSDFGKKYFEHFGYSKVENKKQYDREQKWFINHNHKCRWEKS